MGTWGEAQQPADTGSGGATERRAEAAGESEEKQATELLGHDGVGEAQED